MKMTTERIYASWSKSTNFLNCIVVFNSTVSDIDVEIDQSSIHITHGGTKHRYILSGVLLHPNSCRGLKLVSEKELHFSLKGQLTTKDEADKSSSATLRLFSSQNATVDAIERLQNKWHCSTCRQKLLHDWCFFNRVLPLPSENWSDFADMWFCHNHEHGHKHGKDDQTKASPSQSSNGGETKNNGVQSKDLSQNSDNGEASDSGEIKSESQTSSSVSKTTEKQGEQPNNQQHQETKEQMELQVQQQLSHQEQRKQSNDHTSYTCTSEERKNKNATNGSTPNLKTLQSKGLLSLLMSRLKECFVGETYVLVSRRYVKEANVKVTKTGDAVMCRRCGRQLGVSMKAETEDSSDRVFKFFLHSMIIKDFTLADIKQSDSQYIERFAMDDYLGRLVIEQCRTYNSYRFIIETEDSVGNPGQKSSCLLWLLDPSATVFASSYPHPEAGLITMAQTSVIKLLFKCQLYTGDSYRPVDYVTKSIVSLWRKDDTVHSFSLPQPVFVEMVQTLINNCQQLPQSQRYLNGFHVSYLAHQT